MGTTVHSKTALPDYYSMRDINNNLCNGMWDLYKVPDNRQYCEKLAETNQHRETFLMTPPVNGFMGHENELMRQTILKQESLFRHQLQELHRLYKRQRELMNEFAIGELQNRLMPRTSNLIFLPSHVAPKIPSDTPRVVNFPFMDSSLRQVSKSGTDNVASPPNFSKGKSASKSEELHKYGCDGSQIKLFNVEISADEYTNKEGTQQVDVVRSSGIISDSVGDSLVSVGSKRSQLLADLNQPVQQESPFSNSGFWFPSKELPRKVIAGKEAGICLTGRNSEIQNDKKEQLAYNLNAGKHHAYGYGICLQNSSTQHPLMPLSDQSERQPQRKRTIFGVEIDQGNHGSSAGAPHPPNSYSLKSQSGAVNSSILPWLTGKPILTAEWAKEKEALYQMNLDSLQNHSPQFFKRTRKEENPRVAKILGVPIVDLPGVSKVAISPNCPSDPKDSGSRDSDSVNSKKEFSPESVRRDQVKERAMENGLNNYISGLRHQIDLNSSHNEEEAALSFPKAVVKIATTEIDLEAPAVLEPEMEVPAESDATDNKLSAPFSESTLGHIEHDSLEELARVAAEAIVSISSSEAATCRSQASPPGDLLLWFAEVVSLDSVMQCTPIKDDDDDDRIPEGMDYFEFMTLKLKDADPEKFLPKYMIPESEHDETNMSPKRGRRGQARKRKDFQRDVLPTLVSLSRREVTEDVLTFDEAFAAVGVTWQSSLSRRKASTKNGRGRKRLAAGPDPSGPRVGPLEAGGKEATCRKVAIEERSLGGWGKRTRRLPRQRCASSNYNALPLKC